MSGFVDLSPDSAPIGRCVVLPGRQYSPDAPLLFFAAQTALARGWEVRQVWWDAHSRDTEDVRTETAWVTDQLAAALEGYDGRVVLVAKSLGTLAAAEAAARGLEAAWLTPLLTESGVATALRSYPARQVTLIGTDDPYLDRDVFDALPGERLLVPGDHVLRVAGDPLAMVTSHHEFVRAFDGWLRDDETTR